MCCNGLLLLLLVCYYYFYIKYIFKCFHLIYRKFLLLYSLVKFTIGIYRLMKQWPSGQSQTANSRQQSTPYLQFGLGCIIVILLGRCFQVTLSDDGHITRKRNILLLMILIVRHQRFLLVVQLRYTFKIVYFAFLSPTILFFFHYRFISLLVCYNLKYYIYYLF